MSEMLDDKNLMKERRGKTLYVVAILSWIFMGMSLLGILFALMSGPMGPDELEEAKTLLLSQWTVEDIQLIGKPLINEMFLRLDIQNDLHYTLIGIQLAYLVLGAYGVYLMYQLRKTGFYYYVAYSIIPVVVELTVFGAGAIAVAMVVGSLTVSVVFCTLYGVQLKRMS